MCYYSEPERALARMGGAGIQVASLCLGPRLHECVTVLALLPHYLWPSRVSELLHVFISRTRDRWRNIRMLHKECSYMSAVIVILVLIGEGRIYLRHGVMFS